MASELRELKISEVATIVGGGTPSTKTPDYWDGTIPWITPKDLSGYEDVFISRGSRSITEEGLKASSAKLLPPNSVLYTSRAPIGYVAINDVEVATNQGFKSLVPKKGFDTTYLYYLLKYSKQKVLDLSAGGTFAEISASAMGEVVLQFPSHGTQKAIGRLALQIDKKIRVNQQIASTLEQIAQTIFKSWFVDFDPVHAKSRGELPVGIDAETLALFPDSFEDSELGPIPAGWEIKSLTDLAEYRNGLALQKYPATGDGTDLPVLKIPQLKANSVDGAGFASGEVPERFVITDGDCIFSWSGALEVRIWCGGVAALNQHLFKVVPLETPTWNAYFHTLNHLDEFRAIAEGKATTMGHIKRGDLDNAKFAACPVTLIQKANEVISPLLAEFVVRWQQNRTLISLRDSLLPRLISGELEIPAELLEA